MRRSLALLAALAALAPAPAAAAAGPPVDQPVVRSIVPLPAGVKGLRTESCTWTRDAVAVMCPFITDEGRVQLGTIRPDGSDFRCITCGAAIEGRPGYLYAFADLERFFFATLPPGEANADSGASITPYIGECAPSLLQCDKLEIAEVALPTVPGNLNDREPRLSPDGRHFVWTVVRTDGFVMLMGDLEKTASGYRVTGARVLNPAPAPGTAHEWATRMSFNEAKSFDRGGRLVFASTRDAGKNVDDYVLDLRTGETARLTYNLEWDEDAQFDPSGRYLILGSARRMHNQLRTVALAGTPPFLDAAVIASTAPASLGTDAMRLHNLEKWLTTPEEEAAGGDGAMLNDKRGGWASGAAKSPWSPDGSRAAWGERGPDGATRLVVVRFPELPRQDPACADPDADPTCQTPVPSWAPPVESYPLLPPGVYSIPGPHGGSATLTFGGTILGPLNRVEYRGYTAEDGRVFDGSSDIMGVSRGGLTQTLRSDLAISGTHSGHHTSRVTARGRLVCGTAETVLDGLRLRSNVGQWNPDCGFTTPPMCPNGADADATETGDCSRDGLPNRFAAPEWCAPVRIRLPRVGRIVAVTATIGRRVVARRRGRSIRSVGITPPRTRRYTVRLRLVTADGRRETLRRRLRGCVPG